MGAGPVEPQRVLFVPPRHACSPGGPHAKPRLLGQARPNGKRHRLISHNSKYIRQNRGTSVMADADAKKIKSYMPYA